MVGPYRSAFRGEGIEFVDARPYEVGDDWRRIHWSLSARKNQPYIRLGQEERELTCLIAIDRSPSMNLSAQKQELTLAVAVAFALSAILNGDRVRWAAFGERITYFSPARKGEKLIWGFLAHLWYQPPLKGVTYLRPLLQWITSVVKRRSFVILISDLFFHDEMSWSLLPSIAQKHFVLLVRIQSERDMISLPWGFLPAREVETQRTFTLGYESPPPLPITPSLRTAHIHSKAGLIPALQKALLPPLR